MSACPPAKSEVSRFRPSRSARRTRSFFTHSSEFYAAGERTDVVALRGIDSVDHHSNSRQHESILGHSLATRVANHELADERESISHRIHLFRSCSQIRQRSKAYSVHCNMSRREN